MTTRRWEFKLAGGASSSHRGTSYPYTPSGRKAVAVPLDSSLMPPGFAPTSSEGEKGNGSKSGKGGASMKLKQRRAMQIAYSPGKSIPMTAFMMWMSGSNVNIFSMMMTGMAIINPIKSMMNMGNVFKQFSDGAIDLTVPRLVFIGLNLVPIVIAMYKCSTLGLLPVTSADWTSLLAVREPAEVSAGAEL